MLNQTLNFRSTSITSAALLLIIAAFGSRILGLIRDRILASTFGAGDELDIYFAAFRIPDLIYNIVIAGAVSSAFIPVFISVYTKDKEEAWKLASNFLNVSIFLLLIITVLLALFAPLIVPFLAPGFSGEKMDAAITSTRIMFLSPIFLGLSAILSGILHSFKKFFAYSLAPIFYNIGIIFGALFLVDYFGIHGLAWGVAIGAFLHFIIQVPYVLSSGYSWRNAFNISDKYLKQIFTLLVPRSLGLAAFQVNLWVITAIASTLAAGSIAVFHLANNLQYIPIGIIGISFATAAFPSLSEFVWLKDDKKFAQSLAHVIRLILFIVLPVSMFMFVLRAHVVRIVLGTGEFGWIDTRLTAAALGLFCVGIFAHSLIPVLSRAFYATQNTKTPVLINTLGMLANVVLSAFFAFFAFNISSFSNFVSAFMDVKDIANKELLGLPLAFSLAGILNFAVLFYILSKKYAGTSFVSSIYSAVLKISFSSIAAGLAVYGGLFLIEPKLNTDTFTGLFMQAGFASFCGVVVYLLLMLIFKSEELHSFLEILKKKSHISFL